VTVLGPQSFAGNVALVTGGGSGIGLALAQALARLGAAVAVMGRREEVLDRARATIEDRGGTAITLPADVRDRQAVETAVQRTERHLGPVDVVVNAAAGNFRVRPESMSPNAWDAVVGIVLHGTWNVTQAVGRRAIAEERDAAVLNIGTVGALQGGPATAHSASAKAGVLAMTKSLARAWGPHGIRLNVVTPGITEGTPGAEILWRDAAERDKVVDEIPLGRAATLDDIADAGVFLLSDHAAHITGVNLVVDGGRSLGRA
jgi:NAD(P)-dependent dehydrogenase (short-subunit alcohol dehydrogenase family)